MDDSTSVFVLIPATTRCGLDISIQQLAEAIERQQQASQLRNFQRLL